MRPPARPAAARATPARRPPHAPPLRAPTPARSARAPSSWLRAPRARRRPRRCRRRLHVDGDHAAVHRRDRAGRRSPRRHARAAAHAWCSRGCSSAPPRARWIVSSSIRNVTASSTPSTATRACGGSIERMRSTTAVSPSRGTRTRHRTGAARRRCSPNFTGIARAGLLLQEFHSPKPRVARRAAPPRWRACAASGCRRLDAARSGGEEIRWSRPRGEFLVAQHGGEERLVGRQRRARPCCRARARAARAPRRASRHGR